MCLYFQDQFGLKHHIVFILSIEMLSSISVLYYENTLSISFFRAPGLPQVINSFNKLTFCGVQEILPLTFVYPFSLKSFLVPKGI